MVDRMSARVIGVALAMATWLAAAGAQAQAPSGAQGSALSDPMRPPTVSAGAGGVGGVQDEAPAGHQLQSVLLSGGRKLAIIDGATVPLGGMVGEARLVKISEIEVTLKTGDETEVLKLYPAVEKQPVKRAASRARGTAAAPGPSRQGGSK